MQMQAQSRLYDMAQDQMECAEGMTALLSNPRNVQALNLPELIQMVKTAVLERATQLSLETSSIPIDHINLYLPCTSFMLCTAR